jgi:hypothetical protein
MKFRFKFVFEVFRKKLLIEFEVFNEKKFNITNDIIHEATSKISNEIMKSFIFLQLNPLFF